MNFREISTDAIRFWERGRVFFNVVLTAVFIAACFLGHGTRPVEPVEILASLSGLVVLVVCANLVYCLAYPIDLFVQFSDYQQQWRRVRVAVLFAGTFLACFPAVFVAYVSALPLFAA